MKVISNFLFFSLLLSSCSINPAKITGRYKSSCTLYDQSSLIMRLNNDGSFEYELAYLDETINGTWELDGKKLILKSKYFQKDYLEKKYPDLAKGLTPRYKFTDADTNDIYLLKGNKLLIAEKGGFKKTCYLLKVIE